MHRAQCWSIYKFKENTSENTKTIEQITCVRSQCKHHNAVMSCHMDMCIAPLAEGYPEALSAWQAVTGQNGIGQNGTDKMVAIFINSNST